MVTATRTATRADELVSDVTVIDRAGHRGLDGPHAARTAGAHRRRANERQWRHGEAVERIHPRHGDPPHHLAGGRRAPGLGHRRHPELGKHPGGNDRAHRSAQGPGLGALRQRWRGRRGAGLHCARAAMVSIPTPRSPSAAKTTPRSARACRAGKAPWAIPSACSACGTRASPRPTPRRPSASSTPTATPSNRTRSTPPHAMRSAGAGASTPVCCTPTASAGSTMGPAPTTRSARARGDRACRHQGQAHAAVADGAALQPGQRHLQHDRSQFPRRLQDRAIAVDLAKRCGDADRRWCWPGWNGVNRRSAPPPPMRSRSGRSTPSSSASTATHGAHSWQFNLRRDSNSQFGDADTGFVGYGFRITPAWRVHASHGTTFVAPSFNQLYFPGFGNPALQPERGKNTDVGVTWAASGQEVKLVRFDNKIRGFMTNTTLAGRTFRAPGSMAGRWDTRARSMRWPCAPRSTCSTRATSSTAASCRAAPRSS